MALSNIFREPRREITESAVGVLVGGGGLAGLVYADYRMASALNPPTTSDLIGGMMLGVVMLMLFGLFVAAFVVATHALGDGICNALERRGVHLRPRVRR